MERPHDGGSGDSEEGSFYCEGELGSLGFLHLEGRQQRSKGRKVGTCPDTSRYRMTFATVSFGVCLQSFLVLAARP